MYPWQEQSDEQQGKRADYQASCLEGRGYTVK